MAAIRSNGYSAYCEIGRNLVTFALLRDNSALCLFIDNKFCFIFLGE